jgi:hypothetical protein
LKKPPRRADAGILLLLMLVFPSAKIAGALATRIHQLTGGAIP